MRVYLCGPIFEKTNDECRGWRSYATEIADQYSIDVFNPMRRDYRGVQQENQSSIVVLDKREITLSDVLLVNWQGPSAGTSMEIIYAYDLGKPIVLVYQGKPLSPWVEYHVTQIVPDLDDAFYWINYNVAGA